MLGRGPHTYHIPQEIDPFNDKVRRSLDGTLAELPNTFENWQPEQVKESYEGFERNSQDAQDRIETAKNADAFIAGHPEFIDKEANALLLLNQVQTMFGTGLHTIEQFEVAFEYLRDNPTTTNFLALNKTVLAAQRKEAAKQRFNEAKARTGTPTEEELNSMPLEELRRLDAIEAHNRNQRRRREESGL